MQFEIFKQSIIENKIPRELSVHLQALWQDGKGDWGTAHNIIQDLPDDTASWIHAYLHRKEGNDGNAAYWYRQANKQFPSSSLDQEWEDIVGALL